MLLKQEQKKEMETYIRDFSLKQKEITEELKKMLDLEDASQIDQEKLESLKAKLIEYDGKHLQRMLLLRDENKKTLGGSSWSVMGLIKKLLGLVFALVFFKQILFPGQTDDLSQFDDPKNIKLNTTEQYMILNLRTEEEKKEQFEIFRELRK